MDNRAQLDSTEKQLDEQVVQIDRVARVVKGGRRFHFRALVAVGDHSGNIGIGVSKGVDVTSAVTKAVGVAKKNMHKINLYNDTIPHESEAKVSGAHILIKPASPGTGLIAGGVVRTVLEVAGVRNILSKSLGSNNKINAAYATLEALLATEPMSKWHTTVIMNTPKQTKVTEVKPTEVNKPAKPAVKKATAAKKTKEAKK